MCSLVCFFIFANCLHETIFMHEWWKERREKYFFWGKVCPHFLSYDITVFALDLTNISLLSSSEVVVVLENYLDIFWLDVYDVLTLVPIRFFCDVFQ